MVTRQKKRQIARRKTAHSGIAYVNTGALAPNNSYGSPEFVKRGYYKDMPFTCGGCGAAQVWTGWQQKWWYEVAKGYAHSTARYCRACRHRERSRRTEARRIHLEGVARKRASRSVR